MLIFSNPGEINPLVISTMGLSGKETSSPIGQFGTGLKYAIAVTLRLGGQITIFSGETEITFFTRQETFRGREVVTCHMASRYYEMRSKSASQLPFTLNYGRSWQPWMAVRELWANGKDEGGGQPYIAPVAPKPTAGLTYIIVDEPQMEAAWLGRNWLLEPSGEPISQTSSLQVYEGSSNFGFYRGMRVFDFKEPAKFTYNVLSFLPLTEDRTCPEYDYLQMIKTHTLLHAEEGFVKAVACAKDGMEGRIIWDYEYLQPSEIVKALSSGELNESFARFKKKFAPPAPSKPQTIYVAAGHAFYDINDATVFALKKRVSKHEVKLWDRLPSGDEE